METYLIHTFSTFRNPRLLVIEFEAPDIVSAIHNSGIPLTDILKVELKVEYMKEA